MRNTKLIQITLAVLSNIQFIHCLTVTYYIDNSCSGDLRDKVKASINDAIGWAHTASQQIQNNDAETMKVARMLFNDAGTVNDPQTNIGAATISFAQGILDKIAGGTLSDEDPDRDNFVPKNGDTTFYCDLSRFGVPNIIKNVVRDKKNLLDMDVSTYTACKLSILTQDLAIALSALGGRTSSADKDTIDTIQICPGYFTWLTKTSKYQLTSDYVQQVQQGKICAVKQLQVLTGIIAPIDCAGYTLTHTILHELAHSSWVTTGDPPGDKLGYGWSKVTSGTAAQKLANADNFAYMGMIAWMIQNAGTTADDKGNIITLP